MHVLIIEDQFLVAVLIEDILRDMGCTSCDTVDTAEAAERSARQRRPDLIIADQILMAGTGVEAVGRIRARADIPVLFITSYREDVLQLMPGSSVLGKPFSVQALQGAVRAAIGVKVDRGHLARARWLSRA